MKYFLPKSLLKFVAHALAVIMVACLLLFSISTAIVFTIVRDIKIDIPKDKNIVAIGNSTVEEAFNDEILTNWANLAMGGQYFVEAAPVLDIVLEQNPHVDTVMIGAGVPSFILFTDDGYYTRDWAHCCHFHKNTALARSMWIKSLSNPNFVKMVLTTQVEFIKMRNGKTFGKFVEVYRDSTVFAENIQYYNDRIKSNRGRPLELEEMTPQFSLQIEGLKQIIGHCKKHNVTPVLVCPPVYQIERFMDAKGYDKLLSSLGDSVYITDFQNFQFPDSSYFGNVIHLRGKAAKVLSNHILEKGMQVVETHRFTPLPHTQYGCAAEVNTEDD